ncbi:Putative Efflux transporter, RND family, MFP subunit [Clostridium chauvoei JF4335]|nr:HlyD family efflux transporter periplasmic adaptor subunit [Clostridium chauvoei]CDG01205.1 Putative Efflux transporter, RND family, MFP subunit [Clostridium chauvoei JF4335]
MVTLNKKSEDSKVKVHLVEKGNIVRYINVTGVIQSKNKAEHYLERYKYNNISVKVGDEVKKDQYLTNLDNGNIFSDIDGTVTDISLSEYPVIVVQDLENLKIKILLNQYDSKYIKIDQPAMIKTSNGIIEGRVSFISPTAKSISNSMEGEAYIEGEIDNLTKTEELKIGFKNEIDILVGQKNNVIVVPTEAIKVEKGNKPYVFILKDNIAYKREVKVGLEGEREVEILEGIDEDELVILNPSGELESGDKVKRGN